MSIFDAVIWNVICQHVDSIGTLNKIAEAFPECQAMVERNKGKLEQKWAAWLDAAPQPDSDFNRHELDRCLRILALNHKKQIILRNLTVSEHLHVNQRAAQLGFTGTNFNYEAGRRDVMVSKPKGWRMPWNKAYPIPTSARGERRVRVANPSISEWIGDCMGCHGELNADDANYNHIYDGPWCGSCIARDKTLSRNLQWSTKGKLWVDYDDQRYGRYDRW